MALRAVGRLIPDVGMSGDYADTVIIVPRPGIQEGWPAGGIQQAFRNLPGGVEYTRTPSSSDSMTRESSFLDVLGEGERRTVLSSMHRRRFARGEVVFHEGDPGDAIHILDRGHVAIRVSTPMGEVATLTVLSPGEAFGEGALLVRIAAERPRPQHWKSARPELWPAPHLKDCAVRIRKSRRSSLRCSHARFVVCHSIWWRRCTFRQRLGSSAGS